MAPARRPRATCKASRSAHTAHRAVGNRGQSRWTPHMAPGFRGRYAPRTVASFLQRLGRTGRRPGASRNALFLTTTADGLLQAVGLLLLWSRGYIEPARAPPSPRHIAAQQLLALCLQEGRVGSNVWR